MIWQLISSRYRSRHRRMCANSVGLAASVLIPGVWILVSGPDGRVQGPGAAGAQVNVSHGRPSVPSKGISGRAPNPALGDTDHEVEGRADEGRSASAVGLQERQDVGKPDVASFVGEAMTLGCRVPVRRVDLDLCLLA